MKFNLNKVFRPNAGLLADSYKFSHKDMLPPSTTKMVGNFTPRSIKYMPKAVEKIVVFGIQYVLVWLFSTFNETFFDNPKAITQIKRVLDKHFGLDYDVSHFEELHELGYLPIKFKALPEGSMVKPGIPVLVWENTDKRFAWLVLWLETIISTNLWKPMVNATLSYYIKRLFNFWGDKTTDNLDYTYFQGHDFSMRGLSGLDAVISSGMAYLTSFWGTDSVPSLEAAEYYYDANLDTLGFSVPATEHSVTSALIFYYKDKLENGELDDRIKEFYSYSLPAEGDISNPDYLCIAEWLAIEHILDLYPTGIGSYVADTFNLWKTITCNIARLKDKILARDGKFVVRPDSGNPVDIVCGNDRMYDVPPLGQQLYENLGAIELLWDIFGGTTNTKGYKELDSHIGLIYGDSITYDIAEQIFERLEVKKFAANNIVKGIGSFFLQLNTRDSIGAAAKGTYVVVDKKGIAIYKDPITKGGINKTSAKGLIRVELENGKYVLYDEQTIEEFNSGELKVIAENSEFINTVTFDEIRNRLN